MPPRSLDRICARSTRRPAAIAAGAVLALLVAFPAMGLFLYGMDLMLEEMGLACALRRVSEPGFSWWLLPNGTPLYARPYTQALYPLRWLSLAFPLDWAVTLMPILHLAGAAAAATWLARTFRARPVTAGAVGIAFALSGPALNLIHHSPFLAGALFMPLVWAGARRALHPRGGARPLLAVGLGLLGCLLGGEPQSFAIGAGLVVLEVLLRRPWRTPRLVRRAGLLGASVAASIVASLAVWLPALAESALTPRGGPVAAAEALRRSFTPASWPSLVIPGADQTVQPFTSLSSLLQGATWSLPWDAEAYLGPLMLVAAGLAFARRRTASLTLVAVVGLLFSLGDTLPVLPWLMKVFPPLATFRFPAKYLVVTTLAISVLAGLGLQLAARSRRGRRAFLLGGSAAAALVLAAIAAAAAGADGLLARAAPGPSFPFLPSLSAVLTRGLAQALVPLAGALLVVRFAPNRGRLLPVLLALDLLFAAPSSLQVGPPLSQKASPLAQVPASDAGPNVFCVDPGLEDGTHLDEGTPAWVGSLEFQKTWALGELPACDGLTSAVPYSALRTRVHYDLVSGLRAKSVAAAWALGCTHVVSDEPWPGLERVALTTPPGADVAVLRIPSPVRPAFVVDAPRLLTEGEVTAGLRAARTLAEVTVLVDDPLGRLQGRPLPPPGGRAGIARVEWPRQDDAVVHLSGTGGAVVGLKTIFQAGWRARQGGRELPVVRAMGVHLAAVVEEASAGPVEFRYRPPHLNAGAGASLLGLAMLGVLAFLGRSRGASRKVRS
ncbi:MAG TPA: hypothetical protein VGK67_14685 [Myxococcales bacterium]|jgi:hypothetical protein